MLKIKWWVVFSLLLLLLIYTRFFNLSWGLPYPFHPDERNMTVALQQLSCSSLNDLKNCFNPHFFAYGQLPLYVGFIFIQLFHLILRRFDSPISFSEAALSLRFISAVSSTFSVYLLFKLLASYLPNLKNKFIIAAGSLVFIFSPALIQFSHFGTTESLLSFLYLGLIYVSFLFSEGKIQSRNFVLLSSAALGLAIATKITSLIFLTVPILAILLNSDRRFLIEKISELVRIVLFALLIGFIFSPHNIISFQDSISSLRFESDVATGRADVFYTKQFLYSIPILFQFLKVFPYALGLPALILFIFGFFFLPYDKRYNFLRLVFLIYFIPTSLLFAKWTRFMTPVFPVMLLLGTLFLYRLKNFLNQKLFFVSFAILVVLTVIPGLAYMNIYSISDSRYQASVWMYQNIQENSLILSETANVVDIPIPPPNYKVNPRLYNVISFNFYDLDNNYNLQKDLASYLQKSDYILIPSRRIFENYTCVNNFQLSVFNSQKKCEALVKNYPTLNKYYNDLFSGKLNFRLVSKFQSFPSISLFGRKIEFPDEGAEETWTVFDHPVVRIYKRI